MVVLHILCLDKTLRKQNAEQKKYLFHDKLRKLNNYIINLY